MRAPPYCFPPPFPTLLSLTSSLSPRRILQEGAEIGLVVDNKKLEPRKEFFFSISTHEGLEVCFELITDVDELEQMAADAALERSGGKNGTSN